MDVNVDLLQLFINFLIKKSSGSNICYISAIKNEVMSNQQLAEDCTSQLLEKLKNEKYNHLLKTIFGVLILQICSQ